MNKLRFERIRVQIEYYFGDINLNKDGYLKQLVQEDHGWVSIDVVSNFKRLKRMTTSSMDLIEALGKSELMEISQDGTKIRRRHDKPIPPRNELISDLKKRSVAIIGFPDDISVDQVQTFLNWKATSVTMCREKDNHTFHGKVLATFESEEDARAFLDDPRGKTYHGKALYRMMQVDFDEEMKAFLESEELKFGGPPSVYGCEIQC